MKVMPAGRLSVVNPAPPRDVRERIGMLLKRPSLAPDCVDSGESVGREETLRHARTETACAAKHAFETNRQKRRDLAEFRAPGTKLASEERSSPPPLTESTGVSSILCESLWANPACGPLRKMRRAWQVGEPELFAGSVDFQANALRRV